MQAQPDITHELPIKNLKERLTSLAITQAGFAQLCNVHPNTVSNWANGRTRMNHSAQLVLRILETDHRSAQYVARQCTRGRPRGKPFTQGNPYGFGDKRRAIYVAAAQMERAVA